MSKLYLIASEERQGLVKIGFAGASEDDAVENRIGNYSTGISDSATVYDADGARLFEYYLHDFFGDKRKFIEIWFKSRVARPREWFELPAEIAQALIDAFEREKPKHYSQVASTDLPAFLVGVLAAAHWHNQKTGAYEQLVEQTSSQQLDRAVQTPSQLHADTTVPATNEREIASFPLAIDVARQMDELQKQVYTMRQAESARAIISAVATMLIILLLIMGAGWQAACLAILTFGIMYFWSRLQPLAAAWLLHIARASENANLRMKEDD